jgi:hypothetical protein
MEEKEKKSLGKTIKKIFISIICLLVIFFAVRFFLFNKNNKKEITSEYLGTELTKVGELTSVKLTYTGLLEYDDEGIPIVTKSNFLMTYKAKARVGIDLEDVKVKVDNDEKIVYLDIPKARILDVKIDPASISYYDSKFALFNLNEKEDANQAQILAEKNAYKEINNMGVLESADEQTLTLIKGILQNAVPSDYHYELMAVDYDSPSNSSSDE